LAWPEACLSQNSRGHWAKSAPRKKKARMVAKRVCKAALRKDPMILPDGCALKVVLVFHPPNIKRRRDLQNLIGAMKYSVDGIADATGIDDSQFDLSFSWGVVLEKEPKGCVAVVMS
jgi:crossover junction endodeoxyribonuclease RusA